MRGLDNQSNIFFRLAVKAVLSCSLLILCSFSLRAHDDSADTLARDFRVLFPVNVSQLRANYLDNSATLDSLANFILRYGDEKVDTVKVIAMSSPEGSRARNLELARHRAESMKNFLIKLNPELKDRVFVESGVSPWPKNIEELVLLRYAAFRLVFHPMIIDFPQLELPEVVFEDIVIDEEPLDIPLYSFPELVFETEKPLFAVSTNILYDLAITPNVALEFPIGQHWSILADYTFPWWVTRDNTRAWEVLKLDLGTRYYFSKRNPNDPMDILTGHFVGLDLGGGYYDIEPKHTGWQGEFQTAGLEYGYAWKIGHNWRMQAFVAGGWMGTHYRYYEGDEEDDKLVYKYNGRFNLVGPTKLGLSIQYIFTHKSGRRK